MADVSLGMVNAAAEVLEHWTEVNGALIPSDFRKGRVHGMVTRMILAAEEIREREESAGSPAKP